MFRQAKIKAEHAGPFGSALPGLAFSNATDVAPTFDFGALLPMDAKPRAEIDVPIGVFVWDLLDAYPNSSVILTLRRGDSWFDSFMRGFTVMKRGIRFSTPPNIMTFSSLGLSVPRQALRRSVPVRTAVPPRLNSRQPFRDYS
jgi:hypothetical protein